MRSIATDGVAYGPSVDGSVCLSVTAVTVQKTAQPNEIPFERWTWVAKRNHVLDGGPDPPCEKAVFRGKDAAHCKV